jgi:hypothetical protein
MPAPPKWKWFRCSEKNCLHRYCALVESPGGRCPKCAAYERGYQEYLAGRQRRHEKKYKRKKVQEKIDETEGREQRMREQSRPLDEFLKGQK